VLDKVRVSSHPPEDLEYRISLHMWNN